MTDKSDFRDALDHIARISQTGDRLLITLTSGSFYFGLTILTTTDAQLIPDSGTYRLPIVNGTLSIVALYCVAPIVLLVVYFYLHVRLQRLWEEVGQLPAKFPDKKELHEKIVPGLWSYLVWMDRGGGPALAWAQNIIAIASTWWLTPLTIGLFWLRYLPRHDWGVTIVHVVVLFTAVSWGYFSFYLMKRTKIRAKVTDAIGGLARESHTFKLSGSLILRLVLLLSVLLAVSAGAIHGVSTFYAEQVKGKLIEAPDIEPTIARRAVPIIFSWLDPYPFANLSDEDLSSRPQTWTGKEFDLVKGARLKNRNLRFAYAPGVFLVKANLYGADLYGADLSGAILQKSTSMESTGGGSGPSFDTAFLLNANLREVDFVGGGFERAFLMGADLSGAKLVGARFQKANLFKAKLIGADLRFTQFQGAGLVGADLSRAVLSQADLTDADLSKHDILPVPLTTNLQGAYVVAAILNRTDLRGADLTQVIGLTQDQINLACVDETTKLPSDINMPKGDEKGRPCREKASPDRDQ